MQGFSSPCQVEGCEIAIDGIFGIGLAVQPSEVYPECYESGMQVALPEIEDVALSDENCGQRVFGGVTGNDSVEIQKIVKCRFEFWWLEIR
jgi:hypothetical protein